MALPIAYLPVIVPGVVLAAANTARDIDEFESAVAKQVRPKTPKQTARMIGLFFAQPTSEITKSTIIPKLSDWHHRSDDHIHFYFPGYVTTELSDHLAAVQVNFEPNRPWFYSPVLFERFRKKIQEQSTWTWTGGVDLVLARATFTGNQTRARADFSAAMVLQLDKMKKDEAVVSIEMFFEEIVQFAEKYDGNDPIGAFSNKKGWKVAGAALKESALGALPGKTGAHYKKAEHFAVQNLALTTV